MSCGGKVLKGGDHVFTTSTTAIYVWLVGWMPCIGMDAIKLVVKNKAVSGNLQTQPVVQFAAVRPDNPGDPSTKGSLLVGAGEGCTGVLDISADIDDQFYMRVGLAYSLSEGSTLGQGDVTLEMSYAACGSVLGSWMGSLTTVTDVDAFVAITEWIPALQADKVMVAFVARSLAGNFRYRLCYRTATTSAEDGGSWSTTFDAWRTAGEANTTELALTIGGSMYVQFGIQYALSSGSALGQATISAAVAVRRA